MTQKTHDPLPPEVRELYPWQGRYLPLEHGHRLHYLDLGDGPPVVMVHGNPTWSFHWRELVRDLSQDHRCIVPDHLGCGLSDKPADWGYRVADHVDNLVRLVRELELEQATLVVHDWGGAIGYAAALRLEPVFQRFVVTNTAAFLLPLPRALRALRLPLYGPLVIRGLNAFFPLGLRLATGHRERFTRAVRRAYTAPHDSWASRRSIMRFIEEIPIEEDHPNRALLADLDQGLPDLAPRPHLVLWGLQDPVFHPGYLDAWARRVPGAEIHAWDDVGHWVVEEVPERVIPLVRDFLERSPLDPGRAP